MQACQCTTTKYLELPEHNPIQRHTSSWNSAFQQKCNTPSFISRYLMTPLVKLSFRAFCDKSWNFEGLFCKYQKSDFFKGDEPFPLHLCSSFVRESLRERQREREKKKKKIEVIVKRSSLDHPLLIKVCDVIPCLTSCSNQQFV